MAVLVRKVLFVSIFACLGTIAFADIAFSQATTGVASGTKIDMTAIIVALINLVFPLIGAIATALINARIKNKQLADQLSQAVTNGLGFLKKSATSAATSANIGIDVKNPDLAAAINYVKNNAAESIAHFKVDDDRIAQKIIARLGLAEIATNLATTTSSGSATTVAPMAATVTG